MFLPLLADAASEPWWVSAITGTAGALVLSVLGNVFQWKIRKEDRSENATESDKAHGEWKAERERLQADLKSERERLNELAQMLVALTTETKIHLSSAPDLKTVVETQHAETRNFTADQFRDKLVTTKDEIRSIIE